MIPRFKPDLGKHELIAALKPGSRAVEYFENEFARAFEAKHALAFPYGRSALWGLFNALEIRDAEIIVRIPALSLLMPSLRKQPVL